MTTDTQLLQNQCLHCERYIPGISLPCQDCNVVEYCSEGHKTAGRLAHQPQCKTIKALLKRREEQAKILREDPDGDAFESESLFWSVHENRPYTEACVALIEGLSQIRTMKACKAAVEYALEWLELNWGVDHHNVRYRVAALQIRMGNDQQAYDFIKWYATTGKDPYYDWPELYDLENENMLEDLQAGKWTDDETHLSTMASVTLIKLKICFNLRSLHNASLLADRIPQELLDYIRENFIATNIVADDQQIMRIIRDGRDIESQYLQPLEQQLNEMFSAIEKRNADFWPAIFHRQNFAAIDDPDEHVWELHVAVSAVREAWEETPGAIEWIQMQSQRQASRNLIAS